MPLLAAAASQPFQMSFSRSWLKALLGQPLAPRRPFQAEAAGFASHGVVLKPLSCSRHISLLLCRHASFFVTPDGAY